MAIDKRVLPDIQEDDPRREAVTVNIANEEIGNVSMMEDGSAIIGDVAPTPDMDFDSNLAEFKIGRAHV